MTAFESLPASNEVEISIFSKGIGECCAIHIGGGKWVIIDSLLDSEKNPIALSYLSKIQVDFKDVELLIATHWHDDHVRGMAALLEKCSEAKIAYSTVVCQDEFKAAISNFPSLSSTKFTSGVVEFGKIAAALKVEPSRKRLASAQRKLYSCNGIEIESLSPSDEDISIFLKNVEGWAFKSDIDRIIPSPRRNDTSVAIAIAIDQDIFLFGADLEVREKLSGWHAVHEQYWNNRGRCCFYKIAHHGSITGFHEPVWDDMLVINSHAALTPYGRGVSKVPSIDEVRRIASKTSNGYSAGDIRLSKPKGLHHSVNRTLAEAGIRVLRQSNKMGQIRFRKQIGSSDWNVELFGTAHALDEENYPDAFPTA